MCTRPAPRPRLRFTPCNSTAPLMQTHAFPLRRAAPLSPSYGEGEGCVQRSRRRAVQFLVCAIFGIVMFGADEATARTVRLVAVGDSLMAGYGLGPGEAFPSVLEKALRDKGLDVEVANA